jgi:glutamate--cysteine ligase
MFILRHGTFVDLGGMPFREFIARGFQGHPATEDDFRLHLTTLFPEVRLKQLIEIRGGDSVHPALAVSQVALWKGILYDPAAREEAWDLVGALSWDERQRFHLDAGRLGTDARLGSLTVLEAGKKLYDIACRALREQGEPADLMDPLREVLEEARACPAKDLLSRWLGEWKQDPRRLVRACSSLTLRPTHPPGGSLAKNY